ncbi:MAG: FAD-dependent oxidoreductase [Bacteroidetes bacterium]|nr:FAD-dependent oxidoreductase [Bacteroidota bacterium]
MDRITNHPVLDQPEGRKLVNFSFNGKVLDGYEGEAVSSALISNGVKEFAIHKVNDNPQGIYCANGQCSHCTLIIDGFPLKSCITPLEEGMKIKTLVHIPELPMDETPMGKTGIKNMKCDVLVAGGGPSGLTAAIELAKLDFKVILVDDKNELGGKLLLQTHKFFGSIADCYAGTRGIDIGHKLEDDVRSFENITVLTNASIVGVYKDQKAGIFIDNKNYILVEFDGIVVSSGAREKSLVFPGNNLPGVYGAGAFQTLVNRDLVRSSERIFIVGSGNVGLIGAYHGLQAGIQAVGICDILDKVGGYKVHSDKIKRMGVPIYLRHTVLCAEGDGKVERVTIAEVDENWHPLLETAKTFEVDTLLIAVGLSPVDEFYEMAKSFGFKVVNAGDAKEIAEASSAMFGGRIAGMEMAQLLGKDVEIDPSFLEKAEVLKSHPGKIIEREAPVLNESFQPVIHCDQEIPCNPCTSVCPKGGIELRGEHNNIMDIPYFTDDCSGCALCMGICPGLAITMARKVDGQFAEVVLPHEFIPNFEIGDKIRLTDKDGEVLEEAEVVKMRFNKKFKTHLITAKTTLENAAKIAGIRVQDEAIVAPLENADFNYFPEEALVCKCEHVTVKEVIDYIKEYEVRDVNQLKNIRVGMGSCGGKNCSTMVPRIFGMAGVDYKDVTPGTKRPLSVEVPMFALINEEK